MRAYHNLPEESASVVDKDGWLHTGDIGELDRDGFLRITDRKKDLIKTSGGKYVAPQRIESKLKISCPYIGQVLVHGDRRNYCTALITLDEEAIAQWASRNELSPDYDALTKSKHVRRLIQDAIDQTNDQLASYETIKYFRVVPPMTVEDGILTASLKVKRKVVYERYAGLIDEMYSGKR